MSELDDLVGAARELDEAPPPEAEGRMWAAIVAPIAAPVAATATATAAAGSTATGGSGLLLKIGLGLALAGGGTTVAVIATQPSAPEQPTPAPTVTVAPEPARETAAPPAEPKPVVEPVEEPAQPAVEPETTPTRRRSPPAGGGLADETKLLRSAKVALSDGRAKTARKRLAEHKRRFPKGELVELRMALEVSTLCALDRGDQADQVAKRFLSRFPDSALAAKVRQRCAE